VISRKLFYLNQTDIGIRELQNKIIPLIFITALLIGCSDLSSIDSIETPRKSIKKNGNVVFAEGRWKQCREQNRYNLED